MMRRRSDLPPIDSQPWSGLIPADSFYASLVQWSDVLVDDEDYAPLYKDSARGRPSIPPCLWSSLRCSCNTTTTVPTPPRLSRG
jgi:hypothetical protein